MPNGTDPRLQPQSGMESTPLMQESQETSNKLGDVGDVAVRHAFVQKVYGIVGVQLLVTIVVGGFVMEVFEDLVDTSPFLVLLCWVGCLVLTIGILCLWMCIPDTMRKSPENYFLLGIFTLAESVLVGFVCISYTQESILIAMGLTLFVVFALTLFACQTSIDFTGFGPYLFCALCVLMGFSFIVMMAAMLGGADSEAFDTMRLVYAACGALLFSMYIIYDTQLILGGKHNKNQFSIDDYAFAAVNIYVDIIQLFVYILELFGDRKDS